MVADAVMVLCVCVVCIVDPDASVAITDGPVPPLSFGCWLETLTDTLCPLCLSTQLVHVGLHCPLTGGVIGSGVVDEESAVVLFDHGSIVRGQQWGMGVMVDSASIAHSRGNGDHVRRHVHPLDRCAAGHAPDRGGFGHLLSDPIGSVDGGGVVCPILVKVAEGGGLNCEHHQRCVIDLIIEARPLPIAM